MRSAEAVKAVHERILGVNSRQMRNRAQIHRLLRGRRHQHRVTGRAAGHKVGMIAEDRVVVRGDHAGCDVHDIGQELAAHRVHGRNHQHQALRRSEGGGQRTSLQRTVAGTRSARLGLHLNDVNRRTEQVLASLGRPFIHLFRHRRGRRDRIDRRNLRKGIGYMSRCGVAVHYDIILFH